MEAFVLCFENKNVLVVCSGKNDLFCVQRKNNSCFVLEKLLFVGLTQALSFCKV